MGSSQEAYGPVHYGDSILSALQAQKRASDVWDQFTEADGAELWQIQLEHAARPSAIFNLRDSFQDFLKEAGADSDSGIPTSLDVLQQKAGIKLILSDRNDPDKVFVL